jgi:hypothetical protein
MLDNSSTKLESLRDFVDREAKPRKLQHQGFNSWLNLECSTHETSLPLERAAIIRSWW